MEEQNQREVLVIDGQSYVIFHERLFCIDTGHFLKTGHRFTKKQKRHFMRLHSGFQIAKARKERVIFMTLSTKYDILKDDYGRRITTREGKSIPKNPNARKIRMKQLNDATKLLMKNVEYEITRIMYKRNCKKMALEPYRMLKNGRKKIAQPDIWEKSKFKMQYFKVKTDEGGGVMHIVFRKAYFIPIIPYHWLVKTWNRIWNSTNVSISEVKITNNHGMAMYMIGQYYAKQPVIRMSYGRQWVCQGFVKSFKKLIETFGYKNALKIWQQRMENDDLPTGRTGNQKRFRWRKEAPKTFGIIGEKPNITHWTLLHKNDIKDDCESDFYGDYLSSNNYEQKTFDDIDLCTYFGVRTHSHKPINQYQTVNCGYAHSTKKLELALFCETEKMAS